MRIFDPKDQLGNSLLSSADTQKSSVKLEKMMAVGGGAITLTSTDISDIENWELSNASLLTEGQTFNFLPDTTRNADGSLTVDFGAVNGKAVLVLKRAEFGGVITIEVKIQQLMTKTLIDSKKQGYDASANIAQWKALGVEAKTTEPDNYPYARCSTAAELTAAGLDPSTATTIGKDVCLISFDTFNNSSSGTRTFPNVQTFEADLPSLTNGQRAFYNQTNLQTFNGKIPNVQNATSMFQGCTGLTECTVELPSGLTNASYMFLGCTSLKEWTFELPSGLTTASSMFSGCTSLKEWTIELPSGLTTAIHMFSGCSGLTEWTIELPSRLSNAQSMFKGCTGLTKWTIELPSGVTIASEMFKGCTGLTEWTIELPSGITKANSMFEGCSGLTEWTLDLPSVLSEAAGMFQNCYNLRKWTVDLPSGLSSAAYMFLGCKLNKSSVQCIADSIPRVSGTHDIAIGIDSTQITQAEQNAFNATIVGKGWRTTWQRN